MAESSAPWEGLLVGDAADAPYSSQEWATLWTRLAGAGELFSNYGYLPGTGNGSYPPLQVIASGGSNVAVKPGSALVNGKMYTTDADVTLAVGANASGNPRIDTVILRVDYVAQTIRAILRQGAAAASPVRVTLQQDTTYWEIPLADVEVANGFSSISTENLIDRRRGAQQAAAGWQWFAYPLNHVMAPTYTGNKTDPQFLQPIAITGNMLVNQLVLRSNTTQASRNFKWGIYAQNANDQGANDDILYFIGGWIDVVAYQVNVTSGQNFTVPAKSPFNLSPGHYWLVVENGSGINMPYLQFSAFEAGNRSILVPGVPITLDQTLDTGAASLAAENFFIPARLEGVVFGATP